MAAKVKYKVNLLDVVRRAYNTPQQRDAARIQISDPIVRREIGLAIIDQIEENTLNGRGPNKTRSGLLKFPPYSKSYKESLAFKVYGKSPSPVNLRLTGEMLSSMQSSENRYTIVIDFVDDLNNDKAHGHINGTRNKKTGRRHLPKRDFFALTKSQEEDVVKSTVRLAGEGVMTRTLAEILATLSFANAT